MSSQTEKIRAKIPFNMIQCEELLVIINSFFHRRRRKPVLIGWETKDRRRSISIEGLLQELQEPFMLQKEEGGQRRGSNIFSTIEYICKTIGSNEDLAHDLIEILEERHKDPKLSDEEIRNICWQMQEWVYEHTYEETSPENFLEKLQAFENAPIIKTMHNSLTEESMQNQRFVRGFINRSMYPANIRYREGLDIIQRAFPELTDPEALMKMSAGKYTLSDVIQIINSHSDDLLEDLSHIRKLGAKQSRPREEIYKMQEVWRGRKWDNKDIEVITAFFSNILFSIEEAQLQQHYLEMNEKSLNSEGYTGYFNKIIRTLSSMFDKRKYHSHVNYLISNAEEVNPFEYLFTVQNPFEPKISIPIAAAIARRRGNLNWDDFLRILQEEAEHHQYQYVEDTIWARPGELSYIFTDHPSYYLIPDMIPFFNEHRELFEQYGFPQKLDMMYKYIYSRWAWPVTNFNYELIKQIRKNS